jgi:hypothetical protein
MSRGRMIRPDLRKIGLPFVLGYWIKEKSEPGRPIMFKKRKIDQPRLAYPTRRVAEVAEAVEEYVIPTEEKARVLEELYPFEPVPALNEMMFDLHEEKSFRVGDFRVVRGKHMDLLVSPYFFSSGGTVIDWMPSGFKPGETLARPIRGQSESLLTISLGPRPRYH